MSANWFAKAMNQGVGVEQAHEAKEDESDATAPAVVFGNTDPSQLSQQSPSNVAINSIDEQSIAGGGDGEGIQSALIACLVAKLKVRDITTEELVARLRELQGSPDATSTAVDEVIDSPYMIPSCSPHHPPLTLAPAPGEAVAAQSGKAPQQSATETATETERGTAAVNAAGFFSSHDRQVCPARCELSRITGFSLSNRCTLTFPRSKRVLLPVNALHFQHSSTGRCHLGADEVRITDIVFGYLEAFRHDCISQEPRNLKHGFP